MIERGRMDYSYDEALIFKAKWKMGEVDRKMVAAIIHEGFPEIAKEMINWLNGGARNGIDLTNLSCLKIASFAAIRVAENRIKQRRMELLK